MSNFQFQISKTQIKLFFATMIAMFVVVTLQLFGVKPPRIVLPVPQKTDVFFDVVSPKLDSFENNYNIHNSGSLLPQAEASGEYDAASAYAVIDFDSGDVITSKNLSKQLPIASLTKIMTAVVSLDLAEPTDVFTASKRASRVIPTKIAVDPGEEYTLEELLEAAMLTSANDAVQVIREGINDKYSSTGITSTTGTTGINLREDLFVRAMNEKALLIGLKNTSFTNPQGFDNVHHYSSVEDVAVLTQYALTHYPLLAEIAQKNQSELPANDFHKRSVLYNWNGLINVYPSTIGMKIGNTDAAGKTTVVVSEREGKKIIAVVLGAPGIIERDLWAAQLLDVGYNTTLGLTSVNVTEEQLREKYASWVPWN